MASTDVTQLLIRWSGGDESALEALAPVIQHELHRLASRYMAGERQGHILQPTALVNEAYLRLIDWKAVEWQNKAHFIGTAAQIMRRVLVDAVRSSGRDKRGGGQIHVTLSHAEDAAMPARADIAALDDALTALTALDARKGRVVELRYFGGLSLEETAMVTGVSEATVRRDWDFARAWLYRELSRGR
jgi:RNA polymerase sigma factor (TIGR02999 family)